LSSTAASRRNARPGRSSFGAGGTGGAQSAPASAGPGASFTINGSDQIRVVADHTNNAILVWSTPNDYRMVVSVLRKLDQVPLQVLIEATIAEVRLNENLEYGVQWAFQSGDFSAKLANNTAGIVNAVFPGFNMVLNATEVQAALRLLSEVTDVEIVSSPQIMVLDNQPARLQVGDQVPVATGETISDTGILIQSSVQYFDTGVILEVTPRVNASGLVTLEILQEVSDAVVTESSQINSPTIQQRRIRSIVSVQSGETIALGGLIRERATDGSSGIPVLSDIPLVGNAFKTTDRGVERTELLVLITPRVIRGPAQAREVTDALRQRLTILKGLVTARN
jgi:general secretion pathway protein D